MNRPKNASVALLGLCKERGKIKMTSMILFALKAAQLADRTRVASEEQKVQSRWAGGFPVKKVEKEITVLNGEM